MTENISKEKNEGELEGALAVEDDTASESKNAFVMFLQGRGWFAFGLALILMTAYTAVITVHPIRAGNDHWWHVKTGQYIDENGIPEKDVFSYTAEDHDWHNHEWLSQWLFYKVYEFGEGTTLGGWRTATLGKAAVFWFMLLIVMAISYRITGSWWIALLIAAMALGVGRRTHHIRPPIISNVMIVLLIWLLTEVQERGLSKKWLLLIPPGFALWSNLHGAWFAGLVIMCAYGLQNIIFLIFKNRMTLFGFDQPRHLISWKWLIGIGIGCFAGTLMNPFGYHLYALPGRVMSEKELISQLFELLPPDLNYVKDFILILMISVFCAFLAKRSPRRFAEVFLFLFFLWQGINHIRHLLLFGVMMVPMMSRMIMWTVQEFQMTSAKLLEEHKPGLPKSLPRTVLQLGVLLVAVGWMLMIDQNKPETEPFHERYQRFWEVEEGYLVESYPHVLVDYIERVEFPGRMFNENNYAGYLIWRLSPEKYKVFSDPRFDIFGGEIWKQERIAVDAGFTPSFVGEGDMNWEETLDYWEVDWLLTFTNHKLNLVLSPREDWVKVADFSDVVNADRPWVLFVRKESVDEDFINRARRIADRLPRYE